MVTFTKAICPGKQCKLTISSARTKYRNIYHLFYFLLLLGTTASQLKMPQWVEGMSVRARIVSPCLYLLGWSQEQGLDELSSRPV